MKKIKYKDEKNKGINGYLQRQTEEELTFQIPLVPDLFLVVVIPCYNEPDVLTTLESLCACETAGFGTEVIVLVNSYENTSEDIVRLNQSTFQQVQDFAAGRNTDRLQIIPLIQKLSGHKIGAGIPRKIGMDEALRRFSRSGQEMGVLVSLDADCLVDKNYLQEIYEHFGNDGKLCTATIKFSHPTGHLEETDPLKKAMMVYEKYLTYYKEALEYCGYPYAYYTVGSAFAVRASVYAGVGGMSRQQAGEDFYFLQKVFPLGKTAEINSTTVYPATRVSYRVPFGTGPSLGKMLKDGEPVKYTYSFEAFQILRSFFERADTLYEMPASFVENFVSSCPEGLKTYLEEDEFVEKIAVINKTTSSVKTFRKRFFDYFNAFKVLKFLNHIHPCYIPLKDVCGEYEKLRIKS